MSLYTVSPVTLPPIAGYHDGTGHHQNRIWVVDPSSVPLPGPLSFLAADVDITTMLYQLDAAVVPNWFGVAIPHGLQDFTKPHIFFHPTPGQAGYRDSEYATKSGMWPQLFYYMERLGYQLDAAARSQIIVMPFLTEAAKDTGILPANWFDIVTDILTAVRASMGADDGSALTISEIVVSSFSAGLIYSHNFRHSAAGLGPLLTEVWDFDGRFSSYNWISQNLQSTSDFRAVKYDQLYSSASGGYHVPLPRWINYVAKPTTALQVHGLIRDFMFRHGAAVTDVGAVIGTPESTGGTSAGSAATLGTSAGSSGGTIDTGTFEMPTLTTGATGTTGSVYNGVAGTAIGSATTNMTIDGGGEASTLSTEKGGAGVPSEKGVTTTPALPSGSPLAPTEREPGALSMAPVRYADPCSLTAIPAPTHADRKTLASAEMHKGGCGCVAAVTAVVASVSTTASVALSGITAIASRTKRR